METMGPGVKQAEHTDVKATPSIESTPQFLNYRCSIYHYHVAINDIIIQDGYTVTYINLN